MALGTILCRPLVQAQEPQHSQQVLQLCAEYSDLGDLLTASVFDRSFSISIARPTGQVVSLTGNIPEAVTPSVPATWIAACQLAVSPASDYAALAMLNAGGFVIELIDLATGKLAHEVLVPNKFSTRPVQLRQCRVGFINHTDQLAVAQLHYLPTGEPEIATVLVNDDGSIVPLPSNVIGPRYTEISSSSFDFLGGRVWFLCPAYSARIDRQPRCTLTSASLLDATASSPKIPPPPDDRVVGSGQPNLGFPSSGDAMLLAQRRIWLYHFADSSFRQMNLPETPRHIRWVEFPGPPKFTSDGHFAAVPVSMFHYPLFREGQVSHGTKVVILEVPSLHVVETIQHPGKGSLVDLAVHNDGRQLTLAASWARGGRAFKFRPMARLETFYTLLWSN